MTADSSPVQFVCATANPDKVSEIREILGELVDLLPRPPDVPDVVEDADTLLGNARLKAAAICAATGMPAIADDTGLEVAALDGAPGVFSARYAGEGCTYEDNQRKLIRVLDGVTDRAAAFRTVALLVWPDGSETAADGACRGVITTAPRGVEGFGYDPIFEPNEGSGRTFAEMSTADKHAISHRGRALRSLLSQLRRR